MARSGRACSNCAWRRTDEVPMTAPAGRQANGFAGSACAWAEPRISASRASSRRSVQASTMPGGSAVSRSFRLCTAKSMRRSASASWISLANRPLPPISARRRSCTASPVVRMACSSNTSRLRSTGRSASGPRGSRGSGSERAASRGCRPAAAARGHAASPVTRTAWRRSWPRPITLHRATGKSGCGRSWASRPRATRPPPRCWTRMGACWRRRC